MSLSECATVGRVGRPRTLSEYERREQIVSAATAVFSDRGYRAATMDEVCRRAGMSKKTVYQVFSSKAVILEEILHCWSQPFHTPVRTDGRPQLDVLREYLLQLTMYATDDAQITIARLLIGDTAPPAELEAAVNRQLVGRCNCALEEWLAGQDRIGRIPVTDPADLAAALFFAVAGDSILNRLLHIGNRPGADEILRRIDCVLRPYSDAAERACPRRPADAVPG